MTPRPAPRVRPAHGPRRRPRALPQALRGRRDRPRLLRRQLARAPAGRRRSSASSDSCATDWGGRLIRGWDEAWLQLPVEIGDRIGRAVIEAKAGQTVIGDSTTVLLYKLARAAVDAQVARDPRRREIVVDTDNFPTDRYVLDGIANERGLQPALDRGRHVDGRDARAARRGRRARDGARRRARTWPTARRTSPTRPSSPASRTTPARSSCGTSATRRARCPCSADAWGFDLAVGCTYKYLNGGPGSPAFAYVRDDLQAVLTQPIQGWFGTTRHVRHGARVRARARASAGSSRARRRSSACSPMEETLAMIEEAGMPALRAKSVALTVVRDHASPTTGSPRSA